jgi:hypothetical protein
MSFEKVEGFTQAPAQATVPDAQTQLPWSQVSPASQTTPQAPQLSSSSSKLSGVRQPPPHSVVPVAH